jgi:hypothetical protein
MFRTLDIRPVALLLMRFPALCPVFVAAALGAPSFAAETPADLRSTLYTTDISVIRTIS